MIDMRKEWVTHPVTIEFIQELERALEELKDRWMNGNLTDKSAEGTIQLNSMSIGEAQAYKNILQMIEQIAEA
jgi:hypothetical protein